MKPMNAFADARLESAIWRLEKTVELLDGPVDRCAREAIQRAIGDLVAMRQLLELEAEIADGQADTERPAHLRLVKP
jgi:hypothetical protein